jgi:hypothetical protein
VNACSEVVYHQADPIGIRIGFLGEVAHHLRKFQLSAVLGHPHLSSALEGFEGQQHVGCTPPLILVVDTLWLARLGAKRLSNLGQQLAGPLVEAHYWSVRIVGLFVEVQELFHPPHKLGVVLGWDHPLLDQVRLEFVFLSVLRTVSCDTFSTMPSSTALSAKSLKDQRLRPRGGSEQAKAIRCASARPSKERL